MHVQNMSGFGFAFGRVILWINWFWSDPNVLTWNTRKEGNGFFFDKSTKHVACSAKKTVPFHHGACMD